MTCCVEFYSEVADNWRKRWDEEHNARKYLENENKQLRQENDILKKTPFDVSDVVDLSIIEKRGMYKLWNMLQHVSDYYYFGVDNQLNTDCDATSMTDIIDIHDLDSFLEGYEKWRYNNSGNIS